MRIRSYLPDVATTCCFCVEIPLWRPEEAIRSPDWVAAIVREDG